MIAFLSAFGSVVMAKVAWLDDGVGAAAGAEQVAGAAGGDLVDLHARRCLEDRLDLARPRHGRVEARARRQRLRDAHRVLPGAVEQVGLEQRTEHHRADEHREGGDEGDDLVVERPAQRRQVGVLEAVELLLVAVADLPLGEQPGARRRVRPSARPARLQSRAKVTVSANGRKNSEARPWTKPSGRKTATVVSVLAVMAPATSRVPVYAAGGRCRPPAGAGRCSRSRRSSRRSRARWRWSGRRA